MPVPPRGGGGVGGRLVRLLTLESPGSGISLFSMYPRDIFFLQNAIAGRGGGGWGVGLSTAGIH